MSINDWPEDERPREKLLIRGAQALSDSELLAIFLRTGIRGRSAVDLARDLLARFGGWRGLLAADNAELEQQPGLGRAKVGQLKAILELARRSLGEEILHQDVLTSPLAVKNYLSLCLAHETREVFLGLFPCFKSTF